MNRFNLNKALVIAGVAALIIAGIFLIWWNKKIEINIGPGRRTDLSSIAGLACDNYNQRPISVMLASDPEARPLSGIDEADMVFEMPVTPNGVTRLMAFFQCQEPSEIGSVRSAREDFIPLAAGLKSIYAHWGGEKEALDELNGKIMDNINALKYDGTYFYRKKEIKPPHNGFTSFDRLISVSKELNYSLDNQFEGYPHEKEASGKNLSNLADTIDVNYPPPNDVRWVYDEKSRLYLRSRNGLPEIDKNSREQVSSSVVILMSTSSSFLRDQYITVKVTGEGSAQIYQDGILINGTWKKDASHLDSKLYFYDDGDKEINFAPGKIWVEIISQI